VDLPLRQEIEQRGQILPEPVRMIAFQAGDGVEPEAPAGPERQQQSARGVLGQGRQPVLADLMLRAVGDELAASAEAAGRAQPVPSPDRVEDGVDSRSTREAADRVAMPCPPSRMEDEGITDGGRSGV
jgi:hypothetical protein